MSIFKRKKNKKTEEFNIPLDPINFNNDELEDIESSSSQEKTKEVVETVKSREEMINEIISMFHNIVKKNDHVFKENITNKILARVGLRDLDFNMEVIAMDKHIDRLKKECFELNRSIENLKAGLNLEEKDLLILYKKLTDLTAFQKGIQNQLQEAKSLTFGQLKISTINVTMNKEVDELEKLYDNISIELKGFKSFEEASEYIFYNSGNFLDDLLNKFIKYIKGTKNQEFITKYNKTYFLGSDVVISLEIKEWIDLYNKLKFVIRQIGAYDKKAYQKFMELFDQFEAKYAILMMRTEVRRD